MIKFYLDYSKLLIRLIVTDKSTHNCDKQIYFVKKQKKKIMCKISKINLVTLLLYLHIFLN